MFRTDGQSDQYWAFATMWRVPDNLLHVIFNINAPFGSDYFVVISQHNYFFFGGGGNYYIAMFPLFTKGGINGYIDMFPGKKSTI